MRTVVVLAGGLGTRVLALTGDSRAKALLPVNGVPFLDHKLHEIAGLGGRRVVLLLGHHGDQIVEHVGDGRAWGLALDTVTDGAGLRGTGGAVKHALGHLPERFWITYGDTLLDVDLGDAERQREAAGWEGVMTVLHNRGRWQPSNVLVADGRVAGYAKGSVPPSFEHLDYGYLELAASAFRDTDGDVFDLEAVLAPLVERGTLGAVEARQRFHDIGTPEALAETERWLATALGGGFTVTFGGRPGRRTP